MAATKTQGRSFTLFIVAATVTAAGAAYFSTGWGKLVLVVGLVLLALSGAAFFKIKPEEKDPAVSEQSAVLRFTGVGASLLGWLIVLFGLHATASVPGRFVTTLLGLAVSLVGVVGLLPAAARKNAIWKA